MGLFNWFKPTPVQLLKKKKDQEYIEQLRRIEFTVTPGGGIRYHGISEYGARKYLEEGKEPSNPWDNVLTAQGDLIPWKRWKELNS